MTERKYEAIKNFHWLSFNSKRKTTIIVKKFPNFGKLLVIANVFENILASLLWEKKSLANEI